MAVGLMLLLWGAVTSWIVSGIGVLFLVTAAIQWMK